MVNKSMAYPTILKIVLLMLKITISIIYIPIIIGRFFKKSKKCPPIINDILFLKATELAEQIRNKQISSLKVVRAYIDRINEVNPIINAVIENRFEEALEDAKKVDDFVKKSELTVEEIAKEYPLLGVPITIKGSIAVAGLRHTSGRCDFNRTATEDARSVRKAKSAGAIPLLISNVPELCLNWETKNKLIGSTSNPYDTTRTPAGSSGGEASLMGCGASLVGIGSDIAGSLRLPAHCCGIWGHKPSPHVVSCEGHYPDCKNRDEWNKVFTLGPMARYASDLKILLKVISEDAIRDDLKLDEPVDVKKIKVFYITDIKNILVDRINEDVWNALEKVIYHLDLICDTKSIKVDMKLIDYCAELSFLRLSDLDQVENIFNNKGDGCYAELGKFLRGQSKYEFTSIFYGIFLKNRNIISPKLVNRSYSLLQILRKKMVELLDDSGVFILPTCQTEAFYKNDMFRRIFNVGNLTIFNVLGFPVTNCPVAFSKNGLPLRIQVAAAPNMDRLTLAVAEELEKYFGGWKFF